MIFDLIPSPHSTFQTVLIPTWNSPTDATDIYRMLDSCFPYKQETYELDLWCFNLTCFGGYENAIIFG